MKIVSNISENMELSTCADKQLCNNAFLCQVDRKPKPIAVSAMKCHGEKGMFHPGVLTSTSKDMTGIDVMRNLTSCSYTKVCVWTRENRGGILQKTVLWRYSE